MGHSSTKCPERTECRYLRRDLSREGERPAGHALVHTDAKSHAVLIVEPVWHNITVLAGIARVEPGGESGGLPIVALPTMEDHVRK